MKKAKAKRAEGFPQNGMDAEGFPTFDRPARLAKRKMAAA
jgi:hypothetical protein